jgi:hypothetical protein
METVNEVYYFPVRRLVLVTALLLVPIGAAGALGSAPPPVTPNGGKSWRQA